MNARNFLTLAVFASGLSASQGLFAQDDKPAPKEPAQVFAELDKNSDGKITSSEIPEAQKRFFERLLRVAGKEKEGELTKDDFLKAMKPDDLKVTAPQNQGGPRGGGNRPPPDQMFQLFDRNKDGKLSLDEIPEPRRENFKPLFDRAGKKELTRDEFVQALAQLPRAGAGNGGGGLFRQDAEAAFKRFDANQDGKLTLSETPEPIHNLIERWLRQAGKDKDGSLSLEEVKKFATENRPAAPGVPGGPRPQSALFKKLDANGDGKLSKEELQKAPSLFEELDLNKDGYLDPTELIGAPATPTRPAAG